jgi:hypothetical protein
MRQRIRRLKRGRLRRKYFFFSLGCLGANYIALSGVGLGLISILHDEPYLHSTALRVLQGFSWACHL